jgi:predicted Rossmann fold nucleotide-binding protein DprA/Smf involved in DNA uptake
MQDPVDVLNDWGKNQLPLHKTKSQPTGLTETEKIVYDLLSLRPIITDELAQQTHISPTDILSILSLLEIRGLVKQDESGKFMAIG